EREFLRDVFNLNIVRNNVPFQTCAQRFTKLRFGIDQETFPKCRDENVRVQFAFRVEHACFNRNRFVRLAQIVCDLPVEKSESISPGHAKLCAREEIEKQDSLRL